MEFKLLQKVLVQVLCVDPSEIRMDTTFLTDLGADSLDIYQIVLLLEEQMGVTFQKEEVESIVTVWQAVELMKKYEKENGCVK